MGLDISFVSCPRDEVTEVGEVNALLSWVDNNVMHVENCAYIPISKEDLEKLQGTLNQLTINNCQELFPTQEGFSMAALTMMSIIGRMSLMLNPPEWMKHWLTLSLKRICYYSVLGGELIV